MRFVIQRVNHANVKIDGEVVGNIGHGLLILFGAGQDDTEEMLPKYVDKICKMRIFEDENGKTNLSLADVGGELLIVSQFTLYADCRKGNRPSFTNAGAPDMANALYEKFVAIPCTMPYTVPIFSLFLSPSSITPYNDELITAVGPPD